MGDLVLSYETWALLTDHHRDVVEMTGDLFNGPMAFGDWESEADEVEASRPSSLPPRGIVEVPCG